MERVVVLLLAWQVCGFLHLHLEGDGFFLLLGLFIDVELGLTWLFDSAAFLFDGVLDFYFQVFAHEGLEAVEGKEFGLGDCLEQGLGAGGRQFGLVDYCRELGMLHLQQRE